jgi:hypothetical protein
VCPRAYDARVDLNEFNEFMEESNARALRGRRLARLMFVPAVMALAVPAFFFIAAPNFTGMSLQEAGALDVALPFVGVAGLVVGFIWMVRIFRADPEPKTKGWRYRD